MINTFHVYMYLHHEFKKSSDAATLEFGDGKSWKLIEKLATDICKMILAEFKPQGVSVEVKKFPIPQARHVSVTMRL